MKRVFAVILTSLLCISAAGCGEQVETSSSGSTAESVAADADTKKENSDNSDGEKENENKISIDSEDEPQNHEKEKDDKTAEVTEAEKEQEKAEAIQKTERADEQSEGVESQPPAEESVDPAALAEMYYYDACAMYQTVMLSCPYVLDYDSISADGWAPVNDPNCTDGIKSIEDYYCNLFSEPDALIYERYKEIDGRLYCNDTARGTNIFYAGTTFELVSESDGAYVFNAVSHYENSETGEKFEDETAPFSIMKWNDGYKVTEFTFPM